MKYLLDVNVLLAGIIETHPHYARAQAWLKGREIVLCPIGELGFLRISSSKQGGINIEMAIARAGLEKFSTERKADRIADDLPALDSHPKISTQVTDHYLADLAQKHGIKLATFDAGLKHPSVELLN